MMTPATMGLLALVSLATVFGGYFAWQSYQREVGVQTERARVQKQGEKTHAKAEAARRAVEAKKPSEISADLRRYCLDC